MAGEAARLIIINENEAGIATANDGPILRPETPADIVLENYEKNLFRTTVDPEQGNTAEPLNSLAKKADEPTQPIIPQ